MKQFSVTFFSKLFHTIERFRHQFPGTPYAFIDDLVNRFEINPNDDWINWIINTNNNLASNHLNEESFVWLQAFHNLLAQSLIEYDAAVNKQHKSTFDSIFMRDSYLLKQYHFQSYPLIRKYIKSTENLPMYKAYYYRNDSVFEDVFSSSVQVEHEGNPLNSPTLDDHSVYLNDYYFASIVAYHRRANTNNIKFAGITYEKGGVYTLLQIILDQVARVRFFGGITPSLSNESAYTHGPIFMVTSHLHQTMNREVFEVNLSSLTFIVPNVEMQEQLKQLLYKASSYELINAEEINTIVNNQILTYEQYWKRHCPQHRLIDGDTESTNSPLPLGSSRAISELIENSPLAFSTQTPVHGKQAFFPAAKDKVENNNLLTGYKELSRTVP